MALLPGIDMIKYEETQNPSKLIVKNGKKTRSKRTKEWKIYKLKNNVFLYQLYNQGIAPKALPEVLKNVIGSIKPVTYTTYEGSKSGSISYLLNDSSYNNLVLTARQTKFKIDLRDTRKQKLSKKIDNEFNIFSQHKELGDLKYAFINATRNDIFKFVKTPAKVQKKIVHFREVNVLDLPLEFNLRKPNKNQLVKEGKGRYDDKCMLDIGMDSGIGYLETIDKNRFYDISGKCSYCYAYQSGVSFLDTYFDFTKQEFIGLLNDKIAELGLESRKKLFLRLGQTVEMNIPNSMRSISGFKDNLVTILEGIAQVGQERKVACAMPSKVLEYSSGLSSLLKGANVSLLASIAYETSESRMVELGFNTEKRLNELLKFGYDGVNANIFVGTDITRPIGEMQDDAKRALDFHDKHNDILGLQFLDMRITKKSDALLIGGASWKGLETGDGSLFDRNGSANGNWGKNGQNYMCAEKIHTSFLEIIGKKNRGDIRLCSTHVQKNEKRCGMCFMDRC